MNTNFLLMLCGVIVVVPVATTLLLAGLARLAECLVRDGGRAGVQAGPNGRRRENANEASVAVFDSKNMLFAPRLSDPAGTTPALKLLVSIAFGLLTACSQGASTAPSGAGANAASTAAAPTPGTAGGDTPGNPCDVITAADVAGIIVAPVTRTSADSAPSLCIYEAKSHAKVIINEAQGDAAKGAWMLATKYNATETPVAGVGDEALRDVTGTTLIARKGDRSCRVDVLGYDSVASTDISKDRRDALAKKFGVLCNKIFAAH